MSSDPRTQSLGLRRFSRVAAITAVVAGTVCGTLAAALYGPWERYIGSAGGYELCGPNPIPDSMKIGYAFSVQGTRHPYQFALYNSADSAFYVSPLISNDSGYGISESPFNMKRLRIDNRAATNGTGLYHCYLSD